MIKNSPCRLIFPAVFLMLLAVLAQPAAADVTESPEKPLVGRITVPLLNPSGMIRVDGLSPETDQALDTLKMPGIKRLAFFAEPLAWAAFKKGLAGGEASALLNYFSFITTADSLAEQELSVEDFNFFKEATLNQLQAMAEASENVEIIGEGPRWLTYRLALVKTEADGTEGRAEQITSYVLVNGKVLTLTVTSNDRNQFQDQFRPGALTWRDAYLDRTKADIPASN